MRSLPKESRFPPRPLPNPKFERAGFGFGATKVDQEGLYKKKYTRFTLDSIGFGLNVEGIRLGYFDFSETSNESII